MTTQFICFELPTASYYFNVIWCVTFGLMTELCPECTMHFFSADHHKLLQRSALHYSFNFHSTLPMSSKCDIVHQSSTWWDSNAQLSLNETKTFQRLTEKNPLELNTIWMVFLPAEIIWVANKKKSARLCSHREQNVWLQSSQPPPNTVTPGHVENRLEPVINLHKTEVEMASKVIKTGLWH